MKSLITLYFEGKLPNLVEDKLELRVWVNDDLYEIGQLKNQITIWDRKPWRCEVRIRIAIYQVQNSLFGKRKEEEITPLQEYKYRFCRQINHKFVLPVLFNFIIPDKEPFTHTSVDCSTSALNILRADPVLRTSELTFFPKNCKDSVQMIALHLNSLFREWNKRSISFSRRSGKTHAPLLRIPNIMEEGIFYETYLANLNKFGLEGSLIEADKDGENSHDKSEDQLNKDEKVGASRTSNYPDLIDFI